MSFLPDLSSITAGDVGKAVAGLGAGLAAGALGVNPSLTRMAVAKLIPGGLNTIPGLPGLLGDALGTAFPGVFPMNDWRVKIELGANADYFYKAAGLLDVVGSQYGVTDFLGVENAMAPIALTNGVVFPYTPNITTTHNARYSEQALTHSNYKSYFYEGSDVGAISLAGTFTATNRDDAKYVIAAIMFFRACTKMFYGASSNAGSPPPIVFLSGYGANYLPRVSCVITSFSHTMPDGVDYICSNPAGPTSMQNWVPTESTLTVNLQPVVSRARIAADFDLDKYANGGYLGGSAGGGLL
jgi:hypothetical protein